MPALIGAFCISVIILLGWLMTRMPQPTKEDIEQRTERVTLDGKARINIFKKLHARIGHVIFLPIYSSQFYRI